MVGFFICIFHLIFISLHTPSGVHIFTIILNDCHPLGWQLSLCEIIFKNN